METGRDSEKICLENPEMDGNGFGQTGRVGLDPQNLPREGL